MASIDGAKLTPGHGGGDSPRGVVDEKDVDTSNLVVPKYGKPIAVVRPWMRPGTINDNVDKFNVTTSHLQEMLQRCVLGVGRARSSNAQS